MTTEARRLHSKATQQALTALKGRYPERYKQVYRAEVENDPHAQGLPAHELKAWFGKMQQRARRSLSRLPELEDEYRALVAEKHEALKAPGQPHAPTWSEWAAAEALRHAALEEAVASAELAGASG